MQKAKADDRKKSELSIIRLEEKMIKSEKKTLNRQYQWFMRKKTDVLKREAALKERRAALKGKKEPEATPSPDTSSTQLTAAESKSKRSYRKRG